MQCLFCFTFVHSKCSFSETASTLCPLSQGEVSVTSFCTLSAFSRIIVPFSHSENTRAQWNKQRRLKILFVNSPFTSRDFSAKTRQQIELESCSNPLKMRKVLKFRFKKCGSLRFELFMGRDTIGAGLGFIGWYNRAPIPRGNFLFHF